MQGSKLLNSTKFGKLTTMSRKEADFFFFSLRKTSVLYMLNPSPMEVSGKITNALLPWEQDLAWQEWTVAKPATSHPWRSSQGSSNQNNSFAVLSLWCMTAEKEDLRKLWQTYTSAFRKGEKKSVTGKFANFFPLALNAQQSIWPYNYYLKKRSW